MLEKTLSTKFYLHHLPNQSDPDSHNSPPPDRNTDAGCNTAPFPCHGAAPAAGSPGGCLAGCIPAAHCPRGPALRPSPPGRSGPSGPWRSEEHTSELQSHLNLLCRLLLEKKKIDKSDHGHQNMESYRHDQSDLVKHTSVVAHVTDEIHVDADH